MIYARLWVVFLLDSQNFPGWWWQQRRGQTGTPACVTASKMPARVSISEADWSCPESTPPCCDCVVLSGCYGFWCCPCLACTVSSRFGENTCLPLCDICSLSLTAAFGIPLFGPPPAVLALRASIRNRYKIKVSCWFPELWCWLTCTCPVSGVTLQGHGRLLLLRVVLLVSNAPGIKLPKEQTHHYQHRQCAAHCPPAA